MLNNYTSEDIRFMDAAIQEALRAREEGEIPVGAVLVKNGVILSRAHNMREKLKDPSAHAEMIVLRSGSEHSDSWRLSGVTLYVTKEPCIMCAGAMVNARIARLVYGCRDAKAGGVDSLYSILSDARLNHNIQVTSGVRDTECTVMLREFFRGKR